MTKAFIAVRGGQGAASAAIREQVEKLTSSVVTALMRRQPAGGTFHIEDVQDQVELSLMRDGAHDVARSYVLYRERRAQERAATRQADAGRGRTAAGDDRGGASCPARHARIESLVRSACEGLSEYVAPDAILSRDLQEPVRRRAARRGLQVRHPGCPCTDRAGSGLLLCHRAAAVCTRCGVKRSVRRSRRRRWPGATPITSRSSSAMASRPSCSTTSWRCST